MTISNDRIRRVAEKHVELQVRCIAVITKEAIILTERHEDCDRCLNTRWYPLPVRDWADALLAGGHFKRVVVDKMILADGTKVVEVFVVPIPNISVIRTYYADNADDALLMALEQADGVKE